jgi:hypothetical protein
MESIRVLPRELDSGLPETSGTREEDALFGGAAPRYQVYKWLVSDFAAAQDLGLGELLQVVCLDLLD